MHIIGFLIATAIIVAIILDFQKAADKEEERRNRR